MEKRDCFGFRKKYGGTKFIKPELELELFETVSDRATTDHDSLSCRMQSH